MKKRHLNVLLIIGVFIAILLLMIWLFLGTNLVEESTPIA